MLKKKKFLILIMCTIMTLLTACNQSKTSSNDEEQSDTMEIHICKEVLPSYSFYTIEEFMEALTIWGRESYCKIREKSHYVELSGTYRKTLLAFESGSIKLAVPQLDGEDIPYRNKGSKITLDSYFLYKLPWICYHCVVNDIELTVKISYVSILNDENIDNASSALEVLKILDPDGRNPANYKNSDIYAHVYEEEIQLSDKKVKALIYEKNDHSRIYVDIYYDGMYIIFDFENELPSEEFFKKFGIRYAS